MASDNDSGLWKARFIVLYEASLNLLPQIERQFNTQEVEDWTRLMWRLGKDMKYGR